MVGFCEALQHTPFVVMYAPPVAVISPPLVALVGVMSVIANVVNVGTAVLSAESSSLLQLVIANTAVSKIKIVFFHNDLYLMVII